KRHGPDDLLDLHAYADLRELVEAIIIVECGGNPYPAGAIDRGLELAGVPRPVETIAAAAGTGTGQAALTMAGVATAAATAAPGIQALAALPQWTGVAFVAAGAAL